MRLLTWYYTPVALTFTMDLIPDLTVYDCMDELSAFKDARTDLHELEDRLFKVSDLVFTGGHSLYEAKRVRHPDVHKFPSSIDARHFARARAGSSCPDDVREITGPRIGYFGVIDERMDLSFVAAMADERPDWSFVMLGPVVKIDPASLPQRKNIHWIGGREYDQLPDYIGSWSVGFMPFALNESTRFISPTKTPEFLAAGCPVVSTAIKDVVTPYGDARLIEIAQDPLEAVACVERLMSMAKEPWQAAVDKHLDGNSWDETWLRMHKLIERRLLEQTAPLMLELPQSGGIHA
jgi:glycosyltransferase involved in cell wall biosynthesis